MGIPLDIYAVQATHGLVYGMLLFMVASGFTLVYGMMNVVNLAHTAFYMIGAYLAYTFTTMVGSFWVGLIVAPIILGGFSILVERFLLRGIYTVPGAHGLQLMVTFGLFFILADLVLIAWGSVPISVPPPKFLAGTIPFFGKTYPVYRLFILGWSAAMFIGMALVLIKTRVGILIRAAVSDADMVDALGTNVQLVFTGVFGAGTALAAIAGVIAAPFFGAFPSMGIEILLDCFVVVVIGGFGSLLGAFVAALMIGELQSFGVLWIPRLALVFQFLLMAVVLVVRPTGLFGEKE
ncbi:MAG: branched-chain amino acid ABC transporter permease [Pseudomonadota bacterium]